VRVDLILHIVSVETLRLHARSRDDARACGIAVVRHAVVIVIAVGRVVLVHLEAQY
jgi:hypothetical protein